MVFAIIGGDERQIYLAKMLKNARHTVRMCGFERHESHTPCLSVGDALFGADCVILPIPSTKDGKTVWTPLGNEEILLHDLISAAGKKTLFLTACHTLGVKRECDYFAREDLTIQNALITAEGAVGAAIDETDSTLWGSKVLVTGFGRIGKFLCDRLAPFGCDITATSRRSETDALIRASGYKCISSTEIERHADLYDIIFNTVPQPVLTLSVLQKLKRDCVIIELASPPFGVDFEAANELGTRIIRASGLPAKTAPKTAAEIIYNTINNILNEKL